MIRRVLSVDPGKLSGVCLLELDTETNTLRVLRSAEVDEIQYAQELYDCFAELSDGDVDAKYVVCEKFTINMQTVKNSQAPYSLEQIGVLKHISRECGINSDEIKFQSPADAKAMFPNEALKKVEAWHRGGEGHANDSIRHGLLSLVKTGWVPRQLLDGNSNA